MKMMLKQLNLNTSIKNMHLKLIKINNFLNVNIIKSDRVIN